MDAVFNGLDKQGIDGIQDNGRLPYLTPVTAA